MSYPSDGIKLHFYRISLFKKVKKKKIFLVSKFITHIPKMSNLGIIFEFFIAQILTF